MSYLRILAIFVLSVKLGFAQTAPNTVDKLFAELQQEQTTAAASRELAVIGQAEPTTRTYLANHLPKLLLNRSNRVVWKQEVELAGRLKLTEAIPQLTELLTEDSEDGVHTMYRWMELLNDAPGLALATIGDPSVSEVSKILDNSDRKIRSRAIRVLMKVGTPSAIEALRHHLPNEADPGLKNLIDRHLMHLSPAVS